MDGMKNRPEMLMSHCDDGDESASAAARHKGEFGLIRSWLVGPRVATASTYKRGPRGGVRGRGGLISIAVHLAEDRHKGIGVLHPS